MLNYLTRYFSRILFAIIFLFFGTANLFSQIVQSFNPRFQANQKGGIVFLSNVSHTCGSLTNCTTAHAETSYASGTYSNGDFSSLSYLDIDSDASTFMSSSDSLNLANCSEILFAGLYWSARINTSTNNYSTRNKIKIKLNNGAYQTLTADATLDVPTIGGASWSHPSYYCYKDITSIVQTGGKKGRYTVADLVTQTGNTSNLWGGWSIVVVYKNIFESMRNLTVFDGFANVSIGNSLDIPISGFVTPPVGPVTFELGVIGLDGDRDSQGDQLQFKGASTFVNVSDGLHDQNNFFNSTISNNGVLTPFRNPSYNNTLGYDANIFSPTNTSLNYIGNNASSATIRVTTSSENILTRVITSAIDIFEPDLRANVRINDINGGLVNPGDVLEYTLVGKNIGSDISIGTYMTDSLDPRTTYVPNSIQYTFGPNLGVKTDVTNDDQAEYIAATKSLKFRIGTGANATTGGLVVNSATGADSTVIKFRVTVNNDCLMFQCDNTLDHIAYIFGEGDISGNSYNNDGASDLYDANGCPLTASNTLTINTTTCPPPSVSSNGPICANNTLNLFSTFSSQAQYSWSGPNGFTSTLQNPVITNATASNSGTYSLNLTFPGLTCLLDTSLQVTVRANPTIQIATVTNVSCFGQANGSIAITTSGTSPFTYSWSNGAITSNINNLAPGTYTVTITDANGCQVIGTYTITQPLQLVATAQVTSNYNGYNISCFGYTDGSATLQVSGGTSPYAFSWSNGATGTNLTAIGVGTYTATITDAKGCITTASVTLTQPTPLQQNLVSSTNISCYGGTTGAIDMNVVGGVPTYTYSWSNGATTQDLSNLIAGCYSATIQDLNGCSISANYCVTQPASALSSTETHTNVNCYGNSTGSIDLTVSGGTSPYTYSWSNGASSQDISSLPAGTYNVTVTDSKNCTTTNSITITQPSVPLSQTNSSVPVSCFGGTNGSINLTVSGGTSPYAFSWSNGSNTEDLNNIAAGTYSVTITDSKGCVLNTSISVTQPTAQLQYSVVTSDVSCNGGSNGSISLNPLGGTAPYTYSWTNGSSSQNITNLSAGDYTVSAFDANNCQYTNSFVISQPSALSSSAVTTNINCFGTSTGAIDLTVSGGTGPYTYSWSDGAISQDISSLSAGIYSVIITDSNGCFYSNSYTLSQTTSAVSVSLSGTNVLCFGGNNGAAAVIASGGLGPYSYLWNTGATTSSISGISTGTYSLNVTDSLGCNIIDSVTINQPNLPISLTAITNSVDCFGGNNGLINLSLTGGTIPYSFSWSNGSNSQDISNLTSGTYTVSVTDNNGCMKDSSFQITEPIDSLHLSFTQNNVLCNGGSTGSIDISASGGTVPYSYSWSNGASSQDLTNIMAGTYTVVTTDNNGCNSTITAIISEPTTLIQSGIVTNNPCFGNTVGTIDVTTSGGTSPYSFSWNNGLTTLDITNLSLGTYSLTTTDANGCQISSIFTVTAPNAALNISEIHNNISCFGGSDGNINITASGGTSPYTFSWSNGQNSEDISGIQAGTYIVTVTDFNGCQSNLSISLSQPSAPVTISQSHANVACYGFNTGSIDINVAGGTGTYSYLWSNGATTQDLSNLFTGAYSVQVSDQNNCSAIVSVSISQPSSAISLSETHQDAICISTVTGSINLSVSGGTPSYSYSWTNGATTQDISSLGQGIYTVGVSDANGCVDSLSVEILDPDNLMELSATHTNVSCFGGANGTIDLTVTNGNPVSTYNWGNGATSQDISGLSSGNYYVNVTDINGCVSFLAVQINQPEAPLGATAVITNVVCFGQTSGLINLTPTGGTAPYTFSWNNGQTTEDITNLSAGNYAVIITDNHDCTYSYSATITEPSTPISLSTTSNNVSCFAGSNGSIDLSVIGGVPPYQYSWSNGQNTEDLTGLIAGSYSVNVIDGNGCSKSQTIIISQPANGLQLQQITLNVSCYNGSNGGINLTVTGGTPSYSFLWNNGSTNEDLSNVVQGNYSVQVTDNKNCTASISAQITQPTTPLISTATGTNVLCHNGATGTSQVNATGGTAPYSYTWNNGMNTALIDSLIAGNYTVTVTDANGCNSISNIQITQPSPVVAITTNVNNLCYGQSSGSISASVSGGTTPCTYLWNTGSTLTSINNLPAGPYFLTVTDGNNCTTTFSDTVYQPDSPVDVLSNVTNNICFGENDGLIDNTTNGGTAPYQHLWNTGATSEDLSNLLAGTYTLTILDANGCLLTKNIIVGQPPNGLAIPGSVTNVLCHGDSTGGVNISPTGPDAPFTFLWSNGSTSEDLLNIPAGIYEVDMTNSFGCLVSAAFTVNEPLTPLSYSSNITNVNCRGEATGGIDLTISGGTTPYFYVWSNGSGNQDQLNLTAGNYAVSITDGNGCTLNNSETILEPSNSLATSLSTTNVSCYGQSSGGINLSVNGGTPNYSYSWSNGSSSQDLSGIPKGYYSVTVTDALNCSVFIDTNIYEPNSPLSEFANIQNVDCIGNSTGSIIVTAAGGTGNYTYLWSNGSTNNTISNLIAGNYILQIKDSLGCLLNQNYSVSQPTAPLSVTGVKTDISCFNGNNGTINITVSGGTAPYFYSWSNSQTIEDLTNISAGNYTVIVTDANGCSASFNFSLSQPLSNNLTLSATDVGCFGANTGSIDATISGGSAPYIYLWNTGATTQDVSGLIAGNYTLTATDANGCATSSSVTISQPAFANTLSAVISNALCNNQPSGAIDLSINSANSGFSYSWNNGASTQDINGLISGNYTVSVSDNSGCIVTGTFNVGQPDAITDNSLVTNVSCFGGNNGTINITPIGGTAPYQYNWSNGPSTEDITNLTSGTYFLTITDANSCQQNFSLSVSQPNDSLSATGIINTITCNGFSDGGVDITIQGGTAPYTFSWTNSVGTQDIVNVTAGNYTVTVTDAKGCVLNHTYLVSEPPMLNSTFSVTNVGCFGDSTGAINLEVTGGIEDYIYLWSNGETTQDIDTLSANNYNVIITDANGCVLSSDTAVNQPANGINLTLTATNVSCFGLTDGAIDLTIQGGSSPYTINWNTGQITEDLQNLPGGNYIVTVIDANGCSANGSINIIQPTSPLSISGSTTNVNCYNGSNGSIDVTVSGGTFPYTYDWSNNAISQDLLNIGAGAYTVIVTDNNNCTINASYSVTQPASGISISNNVQNVTCNGGSNGAININVNGGSGPYTYSWSNMSVDEDQFNLTAGIYTVQVTDAIGCSLSSNITVNEPLTAVSIISTITNVTCFGQSTGAINITTSGGTPGYSFLWSNGAITEDISGLASGTYTVNITDFNGCVLSTPISVSQPSAPLTLTSTHTNILCFGNSTGSINLTVNGGSPGYTYSWNNGASTEDISNLAAGTYTVNVTDINLCNASLSVVITQPSSALTATETHQNILCYGANNGSIDLSVNGGTPNYTYLWNTGANTQDVSGLIAGNYSVAIKDANNCTINLSVIITQPSAPLTLQNAITNVNCNGESSGSIDITVIGGTSPYTYYWNTGALTQDLYNIPSGQYTLAVTDANNCVSSAIYNVSQPLNALSATYTETAVSCFGLSNGGIQVSVTGGTSPYTILWPDNTTGVFHNNLPAGNYPIQITDVNGCQFNLMATVTQPEEIVTGFTYDVSSGCAPLTVTFTNTSQGSATNCLWDFGNGQTSNSCGTATYTFENPGCYTISLTNSLGNGCSGTLSMDSLICVLGGPIADFSSTLSTNVFYNGEVQFNNLSVNATDYTWVFGDATSNSNEESPSHAYPVQLATSYEVMLIAADSNGCIDTVINIITIDEDYNVYVPNTFTIDENDVNETFIPIFSDYTQIKKYKLIIFDRWGELIWETTDYYLPWDGRSRGKNCQDGVYTWKLLYEDKKYGNRTLLGHVTLLR